MNIVIRADASRRLGAGHVTRCLSLAGELGRRGCRVTFICAAYPDNLLAEIRRQGFDAVAIAAADEAAESWRRDARATREAVLAAGAPVDWLIVDHYGLDAAWEKEMRPYAAKIMVIDDLANRAHRCDLLLDQNYFSAAADRYETLVPPACTKLYGPVYAMLRPEFARLRARPLDEKSANAARVLVFFGGSDPTNETGKVLEAVAGHRLPPAAYDVVVGGINPARREIEAKCASLPNVSYYCQTDRIAELMAAADCSIGAGGSSAWERCCLGLPTIVVTIADNQVKPMEQLRDLGAIALYDGERSAAGYAAALRRFIEDAAERRTMSGIGRELFDGRGAVRVADNLLEGGSV